MPAYMPIPRDEGLRLLASATSALGSLDAPLRGEVSSHAARIADCLIEVAGGVTVRGAEELYAVARSAAEACVSLLDQAGAVPGAKRVFRSLQELLAGRLEAARRHGDRSSLRVLCARGFSRRVVH